MSIERTFGAHEAKPPAPEAESLPITTTTVILLVFIGLVVAYAVHKDPKYAVTIATAIAVVTFLISVL